MSKFIKCTDCKDSYFWTESHECKKMSETKHTNRKFWVGRDTDCGSNFEYNEGEIGIQFYEKTFIDKLETQLAESQKQVQELVETLLELKHNGCRTGDCPHDKQKECDDYFNNCIDAVLSKHKLSK